MNSDNFLTLTPRKRTWLFAEVCVPLLLLVIVFFPIGTWANPNQSHALERYFGSGDLIAISIALLVPTFLQLSAKSAEFHQNENPQRKWMYLLFLAGLIGAILYGAIKIKYVGYTFIDNGDLDPTIASMTQFCIWYTIACLSLLYAAITDV